MVIETLFKLMIGHALADFALQSSEMAKGKNRNSKPDYVPEGQIYTPCWYYWLTAHALIHAGAVWVATGVVWFAAMELVFHWIIDFFKCEGDLTPHEDQFLHIGCKVLYIILIALGEYATK